MNQDDLDYEEDFSLTNTSVEEDENAMTVSEIYEKLILEDSVILVVSEEDSKTIRAGLTSLKAKDNAKLKNKNMPIDASRLEYVILKPLKGEEIPKGFVTFQIILTKKKAFKIHAIIKPTEL